VRPTGRASSSPRSGQPARRSRPRDPRRCRPPARRVQEVPAAARRPSSRRGDSPRPLFERKRAPAPLRPLRPLPRPAPRRPLARARCARRSPLLGPLRARSEAPARSRPDAPLPPRSYPAPSAPLSRWRDRCLCAAPAGRVTRARRALFSRSLSGRHGRAQRLARRRTPPVAPSPSQAGNSRFWRKMHSVTPVELVSLVFL
jgi:hypothetical protein